MQLCRPAIRHARHLPIRLTDCRCANAPLDTRASLWSSPRQHRGLMNNLQESTRRRLLKFALEHLGILRALLEVGETLAETSDVQHAMQEPAAHCPEHLKSVCSLLTLLKHDAAAILGSQHQGHCQPSGPKRTDAHSGTSCIRDCIQKSKHVPGG